MVWAKMVSSPPHCRLVWTTLGAPYVLKQKGATAWVEGNNALGVVVGNYCTELAIHLAKEHAIGWVVAKGSNHYGICGYYASQMSAEGLMVPFHSYTDALRNALC